MNHESFQTDIIIFFWKQSFLESDHVKLIKFFPVLFGTVSSEIVISRDFAGFYGKLAISRHIIDQFQFQDQIWKGY
jgi:hypothetical protein